MEPKELFLSLFALRTDVYAVQRVNGTYKPVRDQLTAETISDHLAGKISIGVYTPHVDMTRWICFDFDGEPDKLESTLGEAQKLCTILDEARISYVLEFSGNKGYHVWVFCKPTKALYARRFAAYLVQRAGVTCEVFPKQDDASKTPEKLGNLVKLPCCIHLKSGKHSCFVSLDGQELPLKDAINYLEHITQSLPDIPKLSETLVPEQWQDISKQRITKEEIEKLMQEGRPAGQRYSSRWRIYFYHRFYEKLSHEDACRKVWEFNEKCQPPRDNWKVENDLKQTECSYEKFRAEHPAQMSEEFKVTEIQIQENLSCSLFALEKGYKLVFTNNQDKFRFEVRKMPPSNSELKDMVSTLAPEADRVGVNTLISALNRGFAGFEGTKEHGKLVDAQKKIQERAEEEKEKYAEHSFGFIGDRWVETIQKDGQPILLVCEPGKFLEYTLTDKLEFDGKNYLPLKVETDLLYMLPPEPLAYHNEDELDEKIRKMAEKAVDLSKAEKKFGDVWDATIIPFIKHTWNHDDFNTCLFMKFLAQFGSGKTACLGFVGALTFRGILVGGQTLAVILRFCDKYSPTLIWNELEMDAKDKELCLLINNKFQKGYFFYRADQDNQKKVIRYNVYGPLLGSSRYQYADPSTESRFISIPVEETTKNEIDLFFAIREHEEYHELMRMLMYRRLKNKQSGIKPDQETVKKLPISKRSQQKYALLFPFISLSKKEKVINCLLKHEEAESQRRSESEEGIVFNAVLSLLSSDGFEARNPAMGVSSHELLQKTGFKTVKRIMLSLGFHEKRITETIEDNEGNTTSRTVRKWYMNDDDLWHAAVRRLVPFTYEGKAGKYQKTYDIDVPGFKADEIPRGLLQEHIFIQKKEKADPPPKTCQSCHSCHEAGPCPGFYDQNDNNDEFGGATPPTSRKKTVDEVWDLWQSLGYGALDEATFKSLLKKAQGIGISQSGVLAGFLKELAEEGKIRLAEGYQFNGHGDSDG
jgi:hypothetical protein